MSRQKRVLLVQLPIPPPGPGPLRGNVPLAAGYMKLLARARGLEDRFDIEVLPSSDASRLGDQALVEEIVAREPWMLGFTCYLWNVERTLWAAARVKSLRPETLIVIGGPEVTPDNAWVLEGGAQDFAAIGEGEATFSDLLAHFAGGPPLGAIDGLVHRESGSLRFNSPRAPMADLDGVSSPYLAGILDAGDEEQLLLETVRGCIFKCKFCYYPKAYDGLYFVSREKVLANLAHARASGAREVYILDPTLNQRRDFIPFLEVLREGNRDGRLELHAELRGEGITAAHARLLREANFKEVEIGLQSVDAKAQDLMDRRNSLKAFERGALALRAEGIRVKVDLIVGLPGDTVESVRRGMRYLADGGFHDDIQVFQLSVLPGTSFRQEAAQLGLEFQPRPPYYTLRTPDLSLDDMLGLLEEAEDIFETRFDPLPPPALEPADALVAPAAPRELASFHGVDLDRETGAPLPGRPTHAFTLWLRARDAYRGLERAEALVREIVSSNPFTTLQVVLETEEDFPLDVFRRLKQASARRENVYLDRFHEFSPGRSIESCRIVTVLPEAFRSRMDPSWTDDALSHCDLVWAGREPSARSLSSLERDGEWLWSSAAHMESPLACAPRSSPA